MKKYYIPFIVAAMCACQQNSNQKMLTLLPYPQTHKVDQKDNYHGTEISDPYRWLENDTAGEVKAWVSEQNKVSENYFSQVPYRGDIQKRLTEIWNFERFSAPFRV